MYGFEDELVVSNTGGQFGLNQRCLMTKFEVVTYGEGKEAFDVHYNVNDKEFRSRFFPVERLWKGGVELVKDSPEYKEEYAKSTKMISATLIHILKCFVSEDKIKAALQTPVNSFTEYCNVLVKCLNINPMWNVEEIDLFLEWQNKPNAGQDKSWLQVPKNVQQGTFVTKSVKGDFVEVKTPNELYYEDAVKAKHPFKRNKWYIESAYANRIDNSPKEAPSFNNTPTEETPLW